MVERVRAPLIRPEEPLDEPPWRMREEARQRGIEPERIWIPEFGETRCWPNILTFMRERCNDNTR